MILGFSGHRKLARPDVVAKAIRNALDELHAKHGSIEAISSIAAGSDMLFAAEVIRREWAISIVLPFPLTRFKTDFTSEQWQAASMLIAKAKNIRVISPQATDEDAYMECGASIVQDADLTLVVWDGNPASGRGGTGDVVVEIEKQKKPFLVINPTTGEYFAKGSSKLAR